MSDLADFLLARIEEDERGAEIRLKREQAGIVERAEWLGFLSGRDSFAERMLAECEAKRRIVELHHDPAVWHEDDEWAGQYMGDCPGCRCSQPCPTLRLLALPYADHPDYREDWRP